MDRDNYIKAAKSTLLNNNVSPLLPFLFEHYKENKGTLEIKDFAKYFSMHPSFKEFVNTFIDLNNLKYKVTVITLQNKFITLY